MANQLLEDPVIRSPNYQGAARGQVKFKINTAVAALGTTVADAAPIYPGFTLVTGPDDAKGVIMQNGVPGDVYIIKLGDGADLKVYPPTGAAINAVAANGSITYADDLVIMILQYSATQFYTLPLVAS